MKQPKILVKGKMYNIASIWWGEKGEIDNVCYYVDGGVETIHKVYFDENNKYTKLDLGKLISNGEEVKI